MRSGHTELLQSSHGAVRWPATVKTQVRGFEILLPRCLTGRQHIVVEASTRLSSDYLMKPLISISSLVVAGLWSAVLPTNAQVNVTQHHNHASRDGLYIDPAFTQSAAASLTRNLSFNGTIVGNVYAQPLYIEGG